MATQTPSHGSSSGAGAGAVLPRRSNAILRYLDVLLVVLAVPVTLALGAPVVGVVVSAVAWLIQRVLAGSIQRWIAGQGDDARFGLNLVDGFGRIWLLAAAIVLAAVIGGRRDGLAAALLIFCAYSIAFAMRLVSGRPQGEPHR
ncbi:MAG TPA: hypothetical protein VK680_00670 [Solirubrobacteraceae bacterium]|nr:hypothetical protein [Solirubrobacteraceae bacterium]